METPDPSEHTYTERPKSVSAETHCIAGILTTIYGLGELQADSHDVACLWLLHPRLQTQKRMEPIASSTINEWNERLPKTSSRGKKGLIAVSFDQRNHGSREIDKLANGSWRSGNSRHAQDMFSNYHGTATDTSQLLTYLSSYIFPNSERRIVDNIVLGVSLGGHAAWQCVMHDQRISTAIIIIGCPDYVRLMSDRARKSKLESWTSTSPAGSSFLGSKSFPKGLVEAVERYDPAGLLLGEIESRNDERYQRDPTDLELKRLMPLMKSSLQGKRILNLAGAADKLVPYRCSEPFLQWLKNAIRPSGWFSGNGLVLEDKVFEGVGHEMSPAMVDEVHRFVLETLETPSGESTARLSKV